MRPGGEPVGPARGEEEEEEEEEASSPREARRRRVARVSRGSQGRVAGFGTGEGSACLRDGGAHSPRRLGRSGPERPGVALITKLLSPRRRRRPPPPSAAMEGSGNASAAPLDGSLSGLLAASPPPPPSSSASASASSASSSSYSPAAVACLAAVVGFLIVFTIVGNVLVVIAVLTSGALRAPQNLFLVSLASADILVAALVMPFSLANELMEEWSFGKAWCNIYLALDVLFCTSSIVHLCAISLDRYWSVTQAVEYNHKRTPRRIKGIILLVWLLSGVISSPPLISKYWEPEGEPPSRCKLNDETWYILSSCIGSFFAPCVIMVLVYVRIYRVAKLRTRTLSEKRPPPEGSSVQLENGLSGGGGGGGGGTDKGLPPLKTGRGENGASAGQRWWPAGELELELEESSVSEGRGRGGRRGRQGRGPGPGRQRRPEEPRDRPSKRLSSAAASSSSFSQPSSGSRLSRASLRSLEFLSYSLYGICREACQVPETLFKFFFWIGYCNSSLNPVIYTIFNQDFRRSFKHILFGRRRRRRRRREDKSWRLTSLH
ncbi:hypothetical protein JRQ81_016038 [Phrynocephalus forsythii]|uniref:G-protein coupled receptors family 1 profile domain-containing protein n=1 Tax=Phrynocephalus forsythii TaxID=171643 RepID=A0A9Q0XX14_9SAUR|nr:hypothetical protein JRQ81_016038 [Phrynocephalus forsythii]